MLPMVGIIYVPFKNKRHLQEVVASWVGLVYPKDRLTVYIVPNSDPENMMPELEQLAQDWSVMGLPRIVMVVDGLNHGFSGNNNKGIRKALEDGCDFVYLNNGDLKLAPEAINEVVNVAQLDYQVGAAQSLMLYWQKPDEINVAGGVFHIAGYGYAGQNHTKHAQLTVSPTREIGYASGGAVLYRASALRKVGLLEEGFFMYHEDLEFGFRLRVAGYKNVLAEKSLTYHDYQFAINPGMFAWTETYRYVVTLAYWRPLTLLLIAPVLFGVELATWAFAIKGHWLGAKVRATRELLKPKTWKLIIAMRMRMKRLRTATDRSLFAFVSGRIEAQEQSNWIVERIANPTLEFYTRVVRAILFW